MVEEGSVLGFVARVLVLYLPRHTTELPREPNTPFLKEWTLNYRGLYVMIQGIFLN